MTPKLKEFKILSGTETDNLVADLETLSKNGWEPIAMSTAPGFRGTVFAILISREKS